MLACWLPVQSIYVNIALPSMTAITGCLLPFETQHGNPDERFCSGTGYFWNSSSRELYRDCLKLELHFQNP